MEEPLLPGEHVGKKGELRGTYQHVGRTASVHAPSSAARGEEVSVDDIRAASIFSGSVYPPSIHGAVVFSPDSHHRQDQLIASQPMHGRDLQGYAPNEFGRQTLDEVEIRHLLVDHIGHHFCWGSRAARTWKILSIEDCNVYIGTLETFIEERETIRAKELYSGGKVDGEQKGAAEPTIWELDLRSDFPLLFVPYKEASIKIPHSEALESCTGCEGRGEIACLICNVGQKPGFYKPNQLSQCSDCHGRGLIAHQDGSDSLCKKCSGAGKLPCEACGSHGLVKCQACGEQGSLLTYSIAYARWRTFSTRKVAASSAAASVSDEVFHRARGVQLYNTQAYQCAPANFTDFYHLNQFSSQVIAERSPIPIAARIICERHVISVVPVTRVTMAHRNRSFSFYIIGFTREIYIRDYPSKLCWGLCCCFEWLKR